MLTSCDMFFASRNHRVYPICREEAVRLLRSTRMARAYSEGAYTSDYDYERYWHALPLHLCICHLLVSSSCPLSVFNLSVIVDVMTENDICLISVCVYESSQLWSCWCDMITHNCLCMLRLRAMCVADGQYLTVFSLMSLFMYPCTLYQQWYVDQCCVWLSVLSFFTRYWQPLTAHLYSDISDALLCAVQ